MREDTTTKKATTLINLKIFSKKDLSEELGLTRPTLDSRLSESKPWKKLEIKWIDYLIEKNGLI